MLKNKIVFLLDFAIMKIVLLVPDGVAVRNYIYSDFVNELKAAGYDIVLYHQIPEAAVTEIKAIKGNIISDFIRIPDFNESFFSRIIRESIVYARLLQNSKKMNNPSILLFWNRNQKGFKRLTLLKISEIFGFILSLNYTMIVAFEKIYENSLKKNKINKQIETDIARINPDYILNLHQRAVISAPIIEIAKKKSIQTGTVIFSWDNIPKARLISKYNTYFVWSNLMKQELCLLYPEIKESSVKIVGTPQFEFYFKSKYQKSKVDFFTTFGLDINKKTICFSANDTSSPYEAIYLEDICEDLMKIENDERPQILFRKCPVDKTNRFDSVLSKYKDIIIAIEPDWRIENNDTSFVSIFPSYNDIQLLANTVLHSDVVVNLGSTMAHDFAVYNKPCLYLNYDPVKNSLFKVKDVYAFQHFKSMNQLDAVGWINDKKEFLEKTQNALNNPEQIGKDRLKWMERIVKYPLKDNSKNLVKEISQCISV